MAKLNEYIFAEYEYSFGHLIVLYERLIRIDRIEGKSEIDKIRVVESVCHQKGCEKTGPAYAEALVAGGCGKMQQTRHIANEEM